MPNILFSCFRLQFKRMGDCPSIYLEILQVSNWSRKKREEHILVKNHCEESSWRINTSERFKQREEKKFVPGDILLGLASKARTVS